MEHWAAKETDIFLGSVKTKTELKAEQIFDFNSSERLQHFFTSMLVISTSGGDNVQMLCVELFTLLPIVERMNLNLRVY